MSDNKETAVLLTLAIAVALFLRIVIPYPLVFQDDGVHFQGNDAGYHMRVVDALVSNFPHRPDPDPYLRHPGLHRSPVAPLFDWLVAGSVLLWYGEKPSQSEVDSVAVFIPPLLAAGLVVLTYFLGLALVDRRTGLLGALFLAMMPGQLFSRSMLGFTDQHVAEAFLSTLVILLLCLLLRPEYSRNSETACSLRTVALGAAAGVALGLYLLTWVGGTLLILCLGLWATLQLIVDHWQGRSIAWIIAVVPTLAVALLLIVPFWEDYPLWHYQTLGLGLGLSGLVLMGLFSLRFRQLRFAPVLLIAGLMLATGFLALVGRDSFDQLVAPAKFLLGGTSSITELAPLLGQPFAVIWSEFTTAWLLFPAGFVLLVSVGQLRDRPRSLFLWMSLVFFALTLTRVRFGYYLVVYVAVLSATALNRLIGSCTRSFRTSSSLKSSVIAVGLTVAVLLPNLPPAVKRASSGLGPTPEWWQAFSWLRAESPAPLPDFAYFEPERLQDADWSRSYGILTIWDQGYWLARTARRIPIANPTQSGAGDMGRFFLSTDPFGAVQMLDDIGARYVITDATFIATQMTRLSLPLGKFPALLTWSDESSARFYGDYLVTDKAGNQHPIILYYPEYYQTMAVRLQLYGGRAVTPSNSTWVVVVERIVPEAAASQPVFGLHRFRTFKEARAFVALSPPDQVARIVGRNPHVSCSPLEAVPDLEIVYETPGAPIPTAAGPMPYLRIFRHAPVSP